MSAPWLIVTGDFTPRGGMDAANAALATHLAGRGGVGLVGHRVQADLAARSGVRVGLAARPLGMHVLGEPFLDRLGRREAAVTTAAGGRVVVNGGNCRWADVNWLHYVHAAYDGPPQPGLVRGFKSRWHRTRSLRREREIVPASRVVVCNSRRTARDAVELLGTPPDRVRVVYYGCDPAAFGPISPAERRSARAALGWSDGPRALFVGALGDDRKGFDTLYAAWKSLTASPGWDVRLGVVGHGAALKGWRARAAADGLGDRVQFLGFRPDVPRLLAAADVLVHPARYEAYGLGVQEALCRGLPALVGASAGVAEHYPPDLADLLVHDPNDAGELADRLRHWRGTLDWWPGRVAPLAEVLRERTWDAMAAEFVRAVG